MNVVNLLIRLKTVQKTHTEDFFESRICFLPLWGQFLSQNQSVGRCKKHFRGKFGVNGMKGSRALPRVRMWAPGLDL